MHELNPQETQAGGPVTVAFLGGSLVPGLPKAATVHLSDPVTLGELFARLEEALQRPGLRSEVTRHYAVLVDGTAIQHLQGWETLVRPGAAVSVVAPMGGGR